MEEFPSPYLTGLFDKFFIAGESPLLETNRGCPFTCTYCQQGTKYFQKVRHFPPPLLKMSSIMSPKRSGRPVPRSIRLSLLTLTLACSNVTRRSAVSLDSAKMIMVSLDFVGCSTGKNRADTVIANTNILKPGSIFLRSSMQSLNEDALKAVKRQNIKLDAYRLIQLDMVEKNLDSNADMMLGFPKETLIPIGMEFSRSLTQERKNLLSIKQLFSRVPSLRKRLIVSNMASRRSIAQFLNAFGNTRSSVKRSKLSKLKKSLSRQKR